MTGAAENGLSPRAILLRQELEVVEAALKRSARVETTSRDGQEWSSKLRRWRDDVQLSLRNLQNHAA